MSEDGIAEGLTARAICEMVELRVGVLAPKPGDVVIVQVTKAELLGHVPQLVEWLRRKMPGVECVAIGPDVNISVMRRDQLDADAERAAG